MDDCGQSENGLAHKSFDVVNEVEVGQVLSG
jgi:hypothetical protein